MPEGNEGQWKSIRGDLLADEISEQSLKSVIDTAADVGVELFTIDAGWYGDVGSRWPQLVGDWKVGSRLPTRLGTYF